MNYSGLDDFLIYYDDINCQILVLLFHILIAYLGNNSVSMVVGMIRNN